MAFKIGETVIAQPLKKGGIPIGGPLQGKVIEVGRQANGKQFDYAVDVGNGQIIYRDDHHLSVPGAAPPAVYKQPVAPNLPPAPRDEGWINRDTRGDALKLEACEFCNNGLLYYPMSKAVDKDNVYDLFDSDLIEGCDRFILVPNESAVKHVSTNDKKVVDRCPRCKGGTKMTIQDMASTSSQRRVNINRLTKKNVVAIIRVPRARKS
jgi:hypothetical protein